VVLSGCVLIILIVIEREREREREKERESVRVILLLVSESFFYKLYVCDDLLIMCVCVSVC
jgi:hypothetical protein